jgi:hypothetical protein
MAKIAEHIHGGCFPRLGPLAAKGLNLSLTCLANGCERASVIDGKRLYYWFATNLGTDEFAMIRDQLVCSQCGSRQFVARSTSEPGIDTLPPADPTSPVMSAFVMGGGHPIPTPKR